jgi:PAS domain S-box-containing protein
MGSDPRYEALVSDMPAALWLTTGDGRSLYVNDGWSELTGRPRDEGLERGWESVVHPDDAEQAFAEWRAAIRDGREYDCEFRIVRPDGEVRWVAALARRMRGADDVMVGIGLDVTRQRAVEERLATLVRQAPIVMWATDTRGTVTFAEGRGIEALGYPEPTGMSLFEEFADHPEVVDATRRALSGESVTYETTVSDRSFEATVGPMYGAGGSIIGALGIAQDITERRAAEAKLVRSERRFRALVEAAPDPLVGVDERNRIAFVNGRAEREFGCTREELLGRCVTSLCAPDAVDSLRARLRAARSGFPPRQGDLRGLRRDGREFPAEISMSTVETDEGPLVIVACRDVTERVAAERERERLEAELQRGRRLESLGRLAGGVAHDFNNLLAVIRGYAEFLENQVESEEIRADVEEIRRAAERASALVHQLLLFGRREQVSPAVIDLNSVLRDLERLLRRTLGEQIELISSFSDDLQPVRMDPGQVEQAVVNLAVNARDAMPDGGRLEIRTSNYEDGVLLEVADTGRGMVPETASRAFDPFFTTKKKDAHSGLGLATVYGIVEEAGGGVEIESEPERGTTVSIRVPAAKPADPIDDGDGAAARPRGGHGETVLVVEDDPAVLELVRRILSGHGYEVLTASSADDAVAVSERHAGPIDVVLTDVVMPHASGKHVTDRIRADRPDARVLYMTGHADEAVSRSGVADDQMAVIEKPFHTDVLLRRVREVIGHA